MTTSNSCLPYANARRFFAVAGIVLGPPFGPVADLVKDQNPWHGNHNQGAVMVILRAQKVALKPGATCESWSKALEAEKTGAPLKDASPASWEKAKSEWEPWSEEEIEAITDCDDSPCLVKLDEAEGAKMGAVPEAQRREKFTSLVLERVGRYAKTGERAEYEFEGKPVDPWKFFESMGLKPSSSGVKMPETPALWVQKTSLAPGKIKTIRQVMDRRTAVSPDKKEATAWARDAYTDHYFDSWGEFADVTCDAGSVVVTQALMLELDLLKKGDLASRIARPRMRSAMRENGQAALDRAFDRMKKKAEPGGA